VRVDGSPGVVGRRAEREVLRSAVGRGLGGTPSLAVIVGEPGIGKSTLAAQVAADVRADGTRVVYGGADEHDIHTAGQHMAFSPEGPKGWARNRFAALAS
jgi:ABC-type hemin transport system ATPase subunit